MTGRFTAIAALVVVLGAPASAQEPEGSRVVVRGTATTVVGAWKEVRDGEAVLVAPTYELLSIRVSELGMPGFDRSHVDLRGWARLQLGEDVLADDDADLELLVAHLENRIATIRFGRQQVVPGVARMAHVDGINASLRLPAGLGVQGWYGATVHPHFDWDGGDRQGGARISVALPWSSQVGLAYARAMMNDEIAREEVSADATTMLGPVQLVGFAALDTDSARFSEGRAIARVRPIDDLVVSLDWTRTSPDLLLPRTSIFTVFSDVAQCSVGADVEWDPSHYYRIAVDGHALRVDGEVFGYRTALRFTAFREETHRSAIGAEVSRLDDGARGHVLGRVWTRLFPVDPLGVSGDAHVYRFDEETNGVRHSVIGQASLSYDVGEHIRFVATGRGGTTPRAQYLTEGIFRFMYGYNVDVTDEVGL